MKGENIAVRMRYLAAGTIALTRNFVDGAASTHLVKQLLRAVTGIGANYEEARGAESLADFIHKLGVANKEARETLYWLQLARESGLTQDSKLDVWIREANEIVAILTSSIRTSKENAGRRPAGQ
jgi:four helix bundle protein